jgi:hypothetical protein
MKLKFLCSFFIFLEVLLSKLLQAYKDTNKFNFAILLSKKYLYKQILHVRLCTIKFPVYQ